LRDTVTKAVGGCSMPCVTISDWNWLHSYFICCIFYRLYHY